MRLRRVLPALALALACCAALPGAAAAGPCTLRSGLDDLSEGRTDPNGGFARGPHYRVLFLYADFADGRGDPVVPDQIAEEVGGHLQRYYDHASYGRADLTVTSLGHWLRMPHSAGNYDLEHHADENLDRYLKDVMRVADPEVDFSAYDAVEVFNPKGVGLTRGRAFVQYPGDGIRTADGEVLHAAGSSDLEDRGELATTMAHELGHDLGLPDLYDVSGSFDPGSQRDVFRFSGEWDLMGSITAGVEMYAWHRVKLGWLHSTDLRCITRGSTTATLAPVDAPGGVKAIVARVQGARAWVAEVRSPGVYGCKTGVLLYRVEANVETGSGPIRVATARRGRPFDACGALARAPFDTRSPHAYTTSDGVRLDVLASARDGGYVVRVKIPRAPRAFAVPPPPDSEPTHVFP
jgi:M6 family metalloprotease-like protein